MDKDIFLNELLEEIPINKGERVLFSSDITLLASHYNPEERVKKLNQFIDMLKEKITAEGTLLFPTYNWGFCKGKTFNYKKTRSRTGVLSQIALERPDFIRTRHAIYSFAVWGKDAKKLYEMNDTNSFVGDTPFTYLHENNGKMVMLDATESITFMHYTEEKNQVPYRFKKEFHAKYIDEMNRESERMYSMFVRYLDERHVTTHPNNMNWLKTQGVLKEKLFEDMIINELPLVDYYELLTDDIKNNGARNLVVPSPI